MLAGKNSFFLWIKELWKDLTQNLLQLVSFQSNLSSSSLLIELFAVSKKEKKLPLLPIPNHETVCENRCVPLLPSLTCSYFFATQKSLSTAIENSTRNDPPKELCPCQLSLQNVTLHPLPTMKWDLHLKISHPILIVFHNPTL